MSRSFRWNICGRADDTGPKQKRNEKGSESRIVASCDEASRDAPHCTDWSRRLCTFWMTHVFDLLFLLDMLILVGSALHRDPLT